jgi:phosphoribosylaminoimidazole carboxylase PurE protein
MSSFEIPYEITIVSAHRTPKRLYDYATNAENRGIKCIIAGAGGAAHLPGMVASITPLPVIGVPIKTSSLSGNDSLLSIVQMPKGIPVATVAINNSTNAALLACRILSIGDDTLIEKMKTFMKEQADTVITKAEKLEKCGYDEYIKGTL